MTIQRQTDSVLYVHLLHLMVNVLTAYKLSGIASGLDYLHSKDVVHGNLKGVRCRPRVGIATD